MNRRKFLQSVAAVSAASVLSGGAAQSVPASRVGGGRLRQSVCRWCYSKMPLEELCRGAAEIGLDSVELLDEPDWPTVRKFGLVCAVANGPTSIGRGWNRREHHDEFVKASLRLLPLVRDAGIPNMIVFSGNRDGLADETGAANCVDGLRRIMPEAEKCGVTVVMELLNSRIDHKDYQCDRTPWGVKVATAVGSPRFKLLYDIYHMQIMEGDVIRTIRDNISHIAHFHTGGVPGRNEIDETQELQYPAICRAIVDAGFSGYLGQEFIPRHDPMRSLRRAAEICRV